MIAEDVIIFCHNLIIMNMKKKLKMRKGFEFDWIEFNKQPRLNMVFGYPK